MSAVLSLLVLAQLGSEPPRQPELPHIAFQLRVVEMKGVGWRETVYAHLQPVTKRGNASVWTARGAVANALAGKGDTVTAPRVTTLAEAPAHISMGAALNGARVGSSPLEPISRTRFEALTAAPATTPMPTTDDDTRPKFAATFTGRKLDQGVLTKLVLEETRVLAVHQVVVEPVRAVEDDDADEPTAVQVPEVVNNDLSGEWLIPNEGALVISLGAHTVAGASGKAEVRERLVVLEARPIDLAPARVSAAPVAAVVPMPAPAAPSRSLPQRWNQYGAPMTLPPLPDELDTPTALPDSSEPCASPQAHPIRDAKKTDDDSTRTSLAGSKPGSIERDLTVPARPLPPGRVKSGWTEVKPYSFRLPLNGATIEVHINTRYRDADPAPARDADDDCCEGCETTVPK